MLDRREFLKLAVGAAALQLAPRLRASEKTNDSTINEILKRISSTVRAKPLLATAEEHLVDSPDKGLIHWEWSHFRSDIDPKWFPQIEDVNADLLRLMNTTSDIPGCGLDSILQEGFIAGTTDVRIKDYQQIHRELLQDMLTVVVPFNLQHVTPSEHRIEEAMKDTEYLAKSTNQFVWSETHGLRQIKISPLARFGAAYGLSTQRNVQLLAAEDPELDAKAAEAERSGSEEEYQQCVIEDRDRHIVKLARASNRRMVHVILGYGHDLTDDVQESNAEYPQKISQITITSKEIVKYRKKEQELAEQKWH